MNRKYVYKRIYECGIMPTTFVYDLEKTVELAKSIHANGIHIIELLQRTPDALEAISVVKKSVPGMIVGAGTVLNVETAEKVWKHGADYIVSPYYHQDIIDWCNEHELAVVPGCASITEVSHGYDSGLRCFKYFPTNELGGMSVIRQISEIYADARYVATGGITFPQLMEYSTSRYIAAVGSVCMMPQKLIDAHAWDEIARLCRQAVAASLGLELIYAGKILSPAINNNICLFAESRNNYSDIPKHLLEMGEKPDMVFYTNSVDRALAHFAEKGLEGSIIKMADGVSAAVADVTDPADGKRIRLIARHYICRI